jgi:threonine aldolase
MGKKKQRSTQTSKGERRCVARATTKALRRDYMQSSDRVNNQLAAFLRGKNVMLTIPNPNKNETNKRFIRVPAAEQWRRGGKKV